MKKVLFFALAAGVALAACTKNEVRPVEVDQEITFQAVVDKAATKAGTFDNNVKYPTDRPFGTFAFFYTTKDGYSKAAPKYIDNARVSYPTSATEGSAWTTNPKYYWPKQGYLTFMSYSPYTTELSGKVTCAPTAEAMAEIKIPEWDVKANQTVDIMIADRVDDLQSNGSNGGYTGVPTVFRHKLAQVVDFTIKTDKDYSAGTAAIPVAGDKFFYLNKIEIGNIAYKGTFNGTDEPSANNIGAWTKTDDRISTPYVWYTSPAVTTISFDVAGVTSPKTIDNNYLLVLPQVMTAKANDSDPDTSVEYLKLTYTIRTFWGTGTSDYSDETVVQTVDLKSVSAQWEINKKYTYNITVSLDQIYWAPSVEVWESGTTTTVSF